MTDPKVCPSGEISDRGIYKIHSLNKYLWMTILYNLRSQNEVQNQEDIAGNSNGGD